jgi:hypothetical protein
MWLHLAIASSLIHRDQASVWGRAGEMGCGFLGVCRCWPALVVLAPYLDLHVLVRGTIRVSSPEHRVLRVCPSPSNSKTFAPRHGNIHRIVFLMVHGANESKCGSL